MIHDNLAGTLLHDKPSVAVISLLRGKNLADGLEIDSFSGDLGRLFVGTENLLEQVRVTLGVIDALNRVPLGILDRSLGFALSLGE